MNRIGTRRSARRGSLAELVGSVGVIGAAAAIAGLGTMDTVTDATSPAPVAIRSGVVFIALSAADGPATVPLSCTGALRTLLASGPVVRDSVLSGPASLTAGAAR